jgi:hypothetical protein
MAPRKVTKHDVDLAEVARKGNREAIIARGGVVALGIAASALPIWAAQNIVESLAGKNTTVHVNMVVSITVALSLTVNVLQYLKARSQRKELKRQRELITKLEG